MRFDLKIALVAGTVALGAGAVADAATVSFNFGTGTNAYAAPGDPMTFLSSDGALKVTVLGFNYSNAVPPSIEPVLDYQIGVYKQQNEGLGACTFGTADRCRQNSLLDGGSLYEMLTFAFEYADTGAAALVTIGNVLFNQVNTNEEVDIFAGSILQQIFDNKTVAGVTPINIGAYSLFGIGVDNGAAGPDTDQVRVAGFSVDYEPAPAPVPLPAAGWLMLAGLGGLAATRRRRAA
ncbi:VPLPA-CTERM sorting domain-containing protein [Rhodobacter sp. Har01]|uniref:VPLPA-CTERM sorting domain-containing protein n=1 Tax=Rhodobacter sp. Har01 TaxID=2883999 RepID=UPI001D067554|nr:VPLPA-CTERM sorting domain-containing protein [Rhodobacter sp. Har01]MCB6177225.1 VPLPA-CTERM sorting domain-containing protein [Rhodobacter sp. Har01]